MVGLAESRAQSPRRLRGRNTLLEAIRQKRNVIKAVMLRDMRTRFFDHGLGFLIVPLWPLAHMLLLLAINTASGRQAPYGESLNVFFATGLVPTLLFMYVSRFMALSLVMNRPMLAFPIVKVIDVMIGRACLEVVGGFLTLIFLFSILWLMGDDPAPYDIDQAVLAYLATLLLAVGSGFLAGVMTMFFQPFLTAYFLLMVVVYIASGTLFVVSTLPDSISYFLSWNPVVHAVEWMRTAYYPTYSDKILDKWYLAGCGLGSLFLGLLAERLLRRKMLEG